MRGSRIAILLCSVLLLPHMCSAQPYPVVQLAPLQSRAPEITAAGAPWQISDAPMIVQGIVYYATNTIRPFDGNVMMQTGAYDGVPIYADATMEPFSVVYVPVGRGGMRAYERLRDGELAGTTGSRTPSFPVAPISGVPIEERAIGTAGTLGAPTVTASDVTRATPGTPPRTRVETIPRARTTNGIWIQFDGARWYSDGEAVSYTEDRFTRIGNYRGFPVYRARTGKRDTIWIAVVQDGPVAPYSKR